MAQKLPKPSDKALGTGLWESVALFEKTKLRQYNFSGAKDLEDVILILQVCVGISNDDIILSGDPDGDNRVTSDQP